MSLESQIFAGWCASLVFAILLFPEERGRDSALLWLFFVAPLACVLLLGYRLSRLGQEPIVVSNNEFIVKYKLFMSLHKLKVRSINKTIKH
jgi:membrane protease YdiL (CAAX protease family)